MAATRFYFPAEGSGAPSVSPAFDTTEWEQTGEGTRLKLLYKPTLAALSTLANTSNRTVPITTSQDILCNQFVSDPIPPQRIDSSCLFSAVIRVAESALTANITHSIVVNVVSQDGTVLRGRLFATHGGTEYPAAGSDATRIISAAAVTALTTLPGDRIVIEWGGHASAPSAATTFYMRQGTNAASDFALTSGLTTDLNPWCEFSNDLFATNINNYQFFKGGDGMSFSERIR